MKKWKQGLTSLLAVTMLGSVCPAALAAEVPTTESDPDVVAVSDKVSSKPATATTAPTPVMPTAIGTGSQVMIRNGARAFNGDALGEIAYQSIYTVVDVDVNGAYVLARDGVVRTRVHESDLILISGGVAPYVSPIGSTMTNDPDISTVAPIDDTYIEGYIPPPKYTVANGVQVFQGSVVMVRAGARSYNGAALPVSTFATQYTLGMVYGNHAILNLNGVKAVEVNAADVIPQNFHWATITNLPVIVNGNRASVNMPTYRLSAEAQDGALYVRVRDFAWLLNTTNANIGVGTLNGATNVAHGWDYMVEGFNGTEGIPCFDGQAYAQRVVTRFEVDQEAFDILGIYILDYNLYGHTYYSLADLAADVAHVSVQVAPEAIYINTVAPY